MVICSFLMAAALAGGLEAGFVNPPHAAKPHVWYHMMNGNVTKEGVTRDFEALAEEGFGGVQMFDVGCGIPPGGLEFNSPDWFDLLKHAASEARRLGLEVCFPNCSGYSSSGGPWNPPSNGMKRVVFTETRVSGPSRFSGRLPREKNDNGFYGDIAVLAFPVPAAELVDYSGVKTSLDGAAFTLSSGKPFRIGGIAFVLKSNWTWSADAEGAVEVSSDGVTFKPYETFSVPLSRSGIVDQSLRYRNFPDRIEARAVRVTFRSKDTPVTVKEARPEMKFVLADLKDKTFEVRQDVTTDRRRACPDQVVARDAVRDLTDRFAADGTLDWDVPKGTWIILRVGYVCNGRTNHPASKHGVGLEVDKLSSAALDYHFEQYVARICRLLGPLAGKVGSGFNNVLVDSYEVGPQNWTKGFEREFRRRRGYDIRPYLPVFAAHIVGSVEETERFLEDFRRVVADLFAENYAKALTEKCHQYGLKCSIEPYGSCPSDDLQYGQYVDIPMGEFWSNAANPYAPSDGNSRFAASIAHVWGKPICATESFTAGPGPHTGRWMTTPFKIKSLGDLAYSDGVNRFIYHRFTHQPWADDRYLPGMTMGRWGMHLDRTQTWWPYAKPFFRYQARCQYMLQRGAFVADALFFVGEGAPNAAGGRDGFLKEIGFSLRLPPGYACDICPTDAMYALRVEKGEVVAPGGVRYRMLVIPPLEAMTPKMAAAIARLQRKGAKIVWPAKPKRALGLSGGAGADAEVRRIADGVFAAGALAMTPEQALSTLGVAPQVSWAKKDLPQGVGRLNWIHRREPGADWFFVAMPTRVPAELDVSFGIAGFRPEIWDAETGKRAPAAVWRTEGGRTVVRVPFDVCGSKFVVFRKPLPDGCTASEPLKAESIRLPEPIIVNGPWTVLFPNGFLPNALAKGKTEKVAFDSLVSWSDRPEDGVRYFSGSATYRKRVVLPADRPKGTRLVLELGEVREVAEVTVNGKTFDALWHPPFRVDITEAVKGGTLDLSIRVANLWANRLIGDDRTYAPDCEWEGSVRGGVKEIKVRKIPDWVKAGKPSPTGRHTFTTWKHWDKDDELLPSGLIGPVRVLTVKEKAE